MRAAKSVTGNDGTESGARSRMPAYSDLALGTVAIPRLIRCEPVDDYGLASVMHDLKGPLATIDLEAKLLERRGQDAATNHALAVIRQNVTFMDRLVHNLLDLSSDGHRALRTQCRALSGLIERVVERSVSMLDRDRIRLEPCDRAYAFVDPIRIERVVANLLHNALLYSEARSPIIVRVESRHDRVCVSVIDTGPGLSPDAARHVFDDHDRGHDGVDGTGLGLRVCQSIVELHGGEIGVETALGIGSRFFFELPTAPGPAVDTVQIRSEPGRLAGLGILCIDDDGQQRTTATLRRLGATVAVVTSASQALQIASSVAELEVVIIDLDVIGTAAANFLTQLREEFPALPAVMVSALPPDHPSVMREVRLSGARYLAKPLQLERLFATLEELLT